MDGLYRYFFDKDYNILNGLKKSRLTKCHEVI